MRQGYYTQMTVAWRETCPPPRPSNVQRCAAELGYDVTVVRDATADYSDEMMHAALDINMPNYANAIISTDEIVAAIAAL